MWIHRAQVTNYKSFRDSGEVTFTRGMNVIVGANDVGKSAFLEAISLRFGNKPHRTLLTVPTSHSAYPAESCCTLFTVTSGEELRETLSRSPGCSFRFHDTDAADSGLSRLQTRLKNGVTLCSRWVAGQLTTAPWLDDDLEVRETNAWSNFANSDSPVSFAPVVLGQSNSQYTDGANFIVGSVQRGIYCFRAERLNVGACHVQAGASELTPDASNLAAVLNALLSGDPRRARELLRLLTSVFPHVHEVTAPVDATGNVTVHLWTDANLAGRLDLAIPLSESGTGIGQVLAMLVVVLTSTEPRTIMIDEPGSFLHPGAIRALFEILRGFQQHQYIVTTHAPATVAATEAVTMMRVVRNGSESTVEEISAQSQAGVRVFLADVGASLSDVFGADRVLWVEGKTEELCFPVIARAMHVPTRGAKLIAVQSTDSHLGKDVAKVFDVYEQLLKAPSLLPPHVAFLFDREGLSDMKRSQLTERSQGKLSFLPRRMFENYLLDPDAIASVIATEDSGDTNTTRDVAAEVRQWILANGKAQAYWPDLNVDADTVPEGSTDAWVLDVHGAELLKQAFTALTEARVEFRKTLHGPMLTEYLLQAHSASMTELGDVLRAVLEGPPASA